MLKGYISCFLTTLIGVVLLQSFHTEKLYRFESETSHGTAGVLYFRDSMVDTISLNHLQTTDKSAVYIEFVRYTHDPPHDWNAVYGAEGNYRVFHGGYVVPESRLPQLNKFSSPRLQGSQMIYWGFIDEKVFAYRTDLDSLTSDSVQIFEKAIGTDFRYAYDFPIPKDSQYVFRTLAGGYDSLLVNFDHHSVTELK